jgi:hypothetical protein
MRCLVYLGAVALALAACGKVEHTAADGGGPADAAGPATITLHNTIGNGQLANAALVAYQDGDGAWQALTGTAGTYTFPVATGRYGLAVVCDRTTPGTGQGVPFNEVFLNFYAASDAAELVVFSDCQAKPPTTVSVSGTVLGTQAGDTISVSTGEGGEEGALTTWTADAAPGAGILLGRRLVNNRPTGILFTQVTYAAGATFALDFAKQIFPTEVGLTPDPSDTNPLIETMYLDGAGNEFIIDEPANPTTTYRVVPPDKIGNGVSVLSETSITNTASRQVEIAFKTPTAQTITQPQTFAPTSPPALVTSTPYPMYMVTLPRTDHPLSYDVGYTGVMPGTQNGFVMWRMTYSAGWLAASGKAGAELASQMPDLSALAGWKPSYAVPATKASWSVGVTTGPARRLANIVVPAAQGPAVQDGDVVTSSQSNGTTPNA